MLWTRARKADKEAMVLKAIADGAKTSSQIGAVVGASRLAVIGVCNRGGIKLPFAGRSSGWTVPHRPRKKAAQKAERRPAPGRPRGKAKPHTLKHHPEEYEGPVEDMSVMKALPDVRRGRTNPEVDTFSHTERIQRAKARRDAFLTDDIPDPSVGVALIDTEGRQCRWPVSGAGIGMRVCGKPHEIGAWQPYCKDHMALSSWSWEEGA